MTKRDQLIDEFRAQKRAQNASGRIFAAFTIDKIDKKILATMSEEQINAVRDALIAAESDQKHSIDLRLSIPLYFARFYLILIGGRDRRRRTVLAESLRHSTGNSTAGRVFSVLGLLGILGIGAIIAGFGLYWFKTELGIDLNPDQHLQDILLGFFD